MDILGSACSRVDCNSLSPEILAHVLDYETTVEVWSSITGMLSSASKSKVSNLRTALTNTKKGYDCWGYTKWVYRWCSPKPEGPGGP
jgi:hypothetical protein